MKQANANGKSILMPETLLTIDDEDVIRRLLRLKLSKEGYQCEGANNAEQTLNMLVTNPIALVAGGIVINKIYG